ncbi:MAG TPA: 50S ribosomal protein L29 [Clostridiales bacterium]|nr:50S ribosomal protein L29 [Clostridiales bacterium]
MKAQEIHGMSNDELITKLADLKEELFNLRFRHATGQLENPNVISATKKDIARVKTEMRAREIASAKAEG